MEIFLQPSMRFFLRTSLSLFLPRPWRRRMAGLMSATLLTFAGCAMAPERPPVVYTGDPVIDGQAELTAAPVKDRVLWDYRIAAAALRTGRFDEAKSRLDDAINRMGGLIVNDEAAKKARSLFGAESEKTFIGEPYERVMAYYYRGLLYWRDGEPDNARACFRSGQFIDSDAEVDAHKADYVLLDYLDGLVSTKLAGDGSDALVRAQKHTKLTLQPYDPSANVLCFVEFGHGPRKYAAGQYGEQLRFHIEESKERSALLTVAGQEIKFTPWDDLDFQAVTRGGRVMDYILGNKAVFKQTTNTVGDLALAGSAIAADNIYKEKPRTDNSNGNRNDQSPDYEKSQGAEDTALALGVLGLFSKMAAAATTARADTRMWDNLPQYLSFAALRLPPGTYPARLEFLDAGGRRLPGVARTLSVTVGDPTHDTVLFLSELKR
jgi:hypothetical protein